jgi:glycosyltransferase involved in cell wall biosynthesis
MAADTFVIITARNEADRLAATLQALRRAFPDARVWVADDGSIDATAQIAREAGACVVAGSRPVGKGGAATAAAREALAQARAPANETQRARTFVLCDGDLGGSAATLTTLAGTIDGDGAELAVGSFATRAGGGFGLALGFARWAIRRRCGVRTRAPISGQRALSEATLRDVLPFAEGFGMELAMTIDAIRAGHRLVEIELDLEHRVTRRTPAGFAHRARQLTDLIRAYRARRNFDRAAR